MIYIIREATVYAPQPLGVCDVLIAGQRIVKIAPNIAITGDDVIEIAARGMIMMPGMVDSLVHFAGGGGEGGFHTRTPEMPLSDATLAGVTTVIGALGTDRTTRSLPDLLAKARGLENEGLSTYCYTGSYQLPPRTITGDVTDDIVLIDKMIGIGEVAIADHRSSQPLLSELLRVAADARVAGMLAGKAGIVSIHVGDSDSQLQLLHDAVQQSDIPSQQFYPTHMNRNQSLLNAGIQWCRVGGIIDFTTSTNEQFLAEGEIPAAQAVAIALGEGVNVSQLTMSSDGNASLPVFNEQGQLVGLEVGRVASLYESFVQLVQKYNVPIEKAIAVVSTSPASVLKLHRKGRIASQLDADIVLLDAQSLAIEHVFGKGRWLVKAGEALVKGTFE